MLVRVVVAIFGLNGVGAEQYGGFGRAVHFVAEDGFLHLQKEHALKRENSIGMKSVQTGNNLRILGSYRPLTRAESLDT